MKKILSLFIVGFLLVGFSQKKEKQTDWEKENLKGKVKSITLTDYNAKKIFRKIKKGYSKGKKTTKFNNDGNLTEEVYYNSNGSLSWNWQQ